MSAFSSIPRSCCSLRAWRRRRAQEQERPESGKRRSRGTQSRRHGLWCRRLRHREGSAKADRGHGRKLDKGVVVIETSRGCWSAAERGAASWIALPETRCQPYAHLSDAGAAPRQALVLRLIYDQHQGGTAWQVPPPKRPAVRAKATEKDAPDSDGQRPGARSRQRRRAARGTFSREDELSAYRSMLLIRRFEEKAGQLYGMGFDRRLLPSLYRPGGRRRRHADGGQAGRSGHHRLSRPRPHAGTRHGSQGRHGRAHRAPQRLFEGQGRLDAHVLAGEELLSAATASSARRCRSAPASPSPTAIATTAR